MKKFIFQFLILLSIFLLLWLVLSQVNFRGLFRLEERIESAENKLGEIVLKAFQREYRQITDTDVAQYLAQQVNHLYDANDIEVHDIEVYMMRNKDVNAFAIPGRKIVIFSGLVDFCETPEEFIGVLAHEIAHIESRHVSKKLSKEIGLGVFFALITGNYGSEIAKSLLKILTSTAYDRNLEREADRIGMEYLLNAGIDPQPYINLLIRFGEELSTLPKELQWISTHPDSEERARELQKALNERDLDKFPSMVMDEWNSFKERV
jgi:beta-barrel assembly-enhancing protease